MIEIAPSTIIFVISILGTIFGVFHYFKNPQIKTDQTTGKLSDDLIALRKEVLEIKETHLRSVEQDIKNLTASVNELAKTVIRLSTIIDERIPKGSPNLTPPGV